MGELELELELIQTQMAQKPMLRAEVYARTIRTSQNRKKEVGDEWDSPRLRQKPPSKL